MLARWTVLALAAASFLAAAKTHGRQVRLERELAGVFQVVFGGRNPPLVEALWRRDRLVFWSVAALVLLATLAVRWFGPRLSWLPGLEGLPGGRGVGGVLVCHVMLPLVAAFVVAGLTSLVRFVLAVRGADDPVPDWVTPALWGSAFWWTLTLAAFAITWKIWRG